MLHTCWDEDTTSIRFLTLLNDPVNNVGYCRT